MRSAGCSHLLDAVLVDPKGGPGRYGAAERVSGTYGACPRFEPQTGVLVAVLLLKAARDEQQREVLVVGVVAPRMRDEEVGARARERGGRAVGVRAVRG